MKWSALLKIGKTIFRAWQKREHDKGETRAIMDEWQADRLNADLREHHQGRNPTTRIKIKPKPDALVKASKERTT